MRENNGYRHYDIVPCPKPRMTQRDKWMPRPEVLRYWAFKEEVSLKRVHVPDCGSHVIFILPMPKSWSGRKRQTMCGMPHTAKPDVDNLIKALLDAVYANDQHIWDLRKSKIWGRTGAIIVRDIEPFDFQSIDGNGYDRP